MKTRSSEEIKELVKKQYSEIALQDKEQNQSSCCGSTGCSTEVYNIMSDDYSKLEGYNPGADLGLGCGLPTQFAKISKGDVVIDLGSGAGNDCFVARKEAGETGRIIGIDFTPAMIEKARINAEKLGYNNIEFRLGDIEKLPITSNIADVVVSNCVLNLVPDKEKAYSEIFRVLKTGGHFSISDVVLDGELPEILLEAAEMYAGCISGAISRENYLKTISDSGFKNISIQKQKQIIIPADILKAYLTEAQIKSYEESKIGIYSITVYGEKENACCAPGCCD